MLFLSNNKFFISNITDNNLEKILNNNYNLTEILDNNSDILSNNFLLDIKKIQVENEFEDFNNIIKKYSIEYGFENVFSNYMNDEKNNYVSNFNTIRDIDNEINKLNFANNELQKLNKKHLPFMNINFCKDYHNDLIICEEYDDDLESIEFNVITDDLHDLANKIPSISKQKIYDLIFKIYKEYDNENNHIINSDYNVNIKWLNLKNIILDATAIHKSITLEHGTLAEIDNKITMLLEKRMTLVKQYI